MAGKALRAVLFDLDGTLVDTAIDIAGAINRLLLARGGNTLITVSRVRELVSRGVETLLKETLLDKSRDPASDADEFRALLRERPASAAAVYPGVLSCLLNLDRVFELGVVTNKPEMLASRLLTEVGLLRFFTVIVGGDTVGREKPDIKPMLYALAALHVTPSEAVMVGDSYVDAAAARATGLPFYLFSGGYGASSCPAEDVLYRFSDFSDLPKMLRAS